MLPLTIPDATPGIGHPIDVVAIVRLLCAGIAHIKMFGTVGIAVIEVDMLGNGVGNVGSGAGGTGIKQISGKPLFTAGI